LCQLDADQISGTTRKTIIIFSNVSNLFISTLAKSYSYLFLFRFYRS